MPEIRQSFLKRHRKILIIGALFLILVLIFEHDSILSIYYANTVDKQLLHYQKGEKISEAEYGAIKSESEVVKDGETSSITGLDAYLDRSIRDNLGYGQNLTYSDAKGTRLIIDASAHRYYAQRDTLFHLDSILLWAFPQNLSDAPQYLVSSTKNPKVRSALPITYVPYPEEWKTPDKLSCFSCGCSCYTYKDLEIANGHFFVNMLAKDSVIPDYKQGIYSYGEQDSKWIRLTPQAEDGFKITENGCVLYYRINSQPYKLNVCGT